MPPNGSDPMTTRSSASRRSRSTITITRASGKAARRCTRSANLEKWNSLPKNYQAIVTKRLPPTPTPGWRHATTCRTRRALKRLVAGGTQLRPFTNEVLEACLKATNELWGEISAQERRLQEVDRRDAGLSLGRISVVAGGRIHLRQLHDPLAHARLISLRIDATITFSNKKTRQNKTFSSASERSRAFLRCDGPVRDGNPQTEMFHAPCKPRQRRLNANSCQGGTTTMKRRDFIKVTGIGVGGGGNDRSARDRAERCRRLKWRMTTSWPKSLDTLAWRGRADGQRWLARPPTANSKSRPLPPVKSCRACRCSMPSRTAPSRLGHTASYYYFGKDPTFTFGSCIPFGPNARLSQAWYMFERRQGDPQRVLQELQRHFSARRQHHLSDGRLVPQGDQHRR